MFVEGNWNETGEQRRHRLKGERREMGETQHGTNTRETVYAMNSSNLSLFIDLWAILAHRSTSLSSPAPFIKMAMIWKAFIGKRGKRL